MLQRLDNEIIKKKKEEKFNTFSNYSWGYDVMGGGVNCYYK